MDLITQRVPAKNIGLPDWTKKVLKEHGLKEDEVEVIRKGITPEDTKFKESERSSVDYITTKTVDRDGEIVVPNGAVLDHYRKHPVVLFSHNYKELPIGKSLWIKADDKGLISKTQYAKHKKAEEIYQYRKDGFPLAKSIGFIPLEVVEEADFDKLDLKALDLKPDDLKGASRVYPSWLMLEYSDVPIPANPDALQLAISKGIITAEEIETAVKDKAFVLEIITSEKEFSEEAILKPETTDNYHHIPIRNSADFVKGSFRTIDISKKKGIKAVIGKLKSDPKGPTKIQKYLFSTDKFSMAEAHEWVDSHKDLIPEQLKQEELEKRYGKESVSPTLLIIGEADAIPEEVANKLFPCESLVFKSVEGADGAWNEAYKELKIDELEAEPSTALYDIASKWLECEIKDIFVHRNMIPSAEMGSYLTGLDEALKEFELITARNFEYDGSESPLEYGIIRLTSEKSSDFLVEGMEFYETEKSEKEGEKIIEKSTKRIIIKRSQSWYGFQLTAFSTNKEKDVSIKLFSDAQKWADENNFLKGESFALSGKFLKKTEEDWSDLFLEQKNESVVKRTVALINEKGADLANRGLIFMGPPGTGKTLSGRIIRNNSDVTFIWVSARDFIYAGSVGGISYGFSLARKLAPSILFIEDVDNWLGPQTTDLMKTEMDGITQSKGVVTMLTSNYPELLPPALIDRPGRFHDVLNFALPNAEIRIRMVKAWTEGVHEKILDEIITDTKEFSGAHMFELVSFAKTIMDEDEITIDEALIVSLQKIIEQRELIDSLKDGAMRRKGLEYEESVKLSQAVVKKLEEEIEEKAGKVLSKATRELMQLAIDYMGKSTAALCELFDSADLNPEVEEIEEEVEVEEVAEERQIEIEAAEEVVFEVDKEVLSDAIASALKDTLSSHLSVSAGDIVKQRLDKATGKIY